ncbi:hypothetical protein FI667_g7912, partial [Globisporangium splendens]
MPRRIDDDDVEHKMQVDESSDDAEWVPPPVVHAVKVEPSDETERQPSRTKKRPLSTCNSGMALVPRPLSAGSSSSSSRASAGGTATTPSARVLQITLTIGDWLGTFGYFSLIDYVEAE